jgi:uncharacterized protein (TIGR03083 family)
VHATVGSYRDGRKGVQMLDGSSISLVLDLYRPERAALLDLFGGLTHEDWDRPTECRAYSVKGIATHILGDDLSLLSRQRDGAENGLVALRSELPTADFGTLLDTFNDRWVATAGFLSTALLTELLRQSGEWTAAYYDRVDPNAPGESVGVFGARPGESSPLWQAIAREYMERWAHHCQIRRALGLSSLDDRRFLAGGVQVMGSGLRMEPRVPLDADGDWAVGELVLGPTAQAAAVLTRAYTAQAVQQLLRGPSTLIERLSPILGRP